MCASLFLFFVPISVANTLCVSARVCTFASRFSSFVLPLIHQGSSSYTLTASQLHASLIFKLQLREMYVLSL